MYVLRHAGVVSGVDAGFMVTTGKPIMDGFFIVHEEVPGESHSEDLSWWLREIGYFASYNVRISKVA